MLSIRGSETMWDWIQNIQLWSAAGLSQLLKWFIPYGWIFNPILPDFIQAVNLIESKKISEVSYYKVTTRFVNEVTAGYSNQYGGGNFENLKVSGKIDFGFAWQFSLNEMPGDRSKSWRGIGHHHWGTNQCLHRGHFGAWGDPLAKSVRPSYLNRSTEHSGTSHLIGPPRSSLTARHDIRFSISFLSAIT